MSADKSDANVNTSASVAGMGKPPMVMRSFRVPAKLWERLKARAEADEMDISQVLRELIERHLGDRK